VAAYSVILTKKAMKEVDSIGRRADRTRIMERIHKLAGNPRPHGSQKLTGPAERYRLRQGDYRILYEIHNEVLSHRRQRWPPQRCLPPWARIESGE
jgi:mRNA interferase RelE/StbE